MKISYHTGVSSNMVWKGTIFRFSGSIILRMRNCGQESGDSVNHRGRFHPRKVMARCRDLHPPVPETAGLSALATWRQVTGPTRSI